jgi:DNA-binding NarL/FixJ family response regulator
MPLRDVIAYALSPARPRSSAGVDGTAVGPHDPAPLSAPPGPLTAREREVAALVADGLTNRRIGEELVISERTVDRHVENILAKLEVRSRAQIAIWVERHRSGAAAPT